MGGLCRGYFGISGRKKGSPNAPHGGFPRFGLPVPCNGDYGVLGSILESPYPLASYVQALRSNVVT